MEIHGKLFGLKYDANPEGTPQVTLLIEDDGFWEETEVVFHPDWLVDLSKVCLVTHNKRVTDND